MSNANSVIVHSDLLYWTHPKCSLSSEAFKQGGRRGAKKVMIVITDGESHDSPDLQQAIEDSEKEGITRYAIAVSLLELSFTLVNYLYLLGFPIAKKFPAYY